MSNSSTGDVDDCQRPLTNFLISDQILQLSRQLQITSEELHQQVRERHGALLQQATQVDQLDTTLNALFQDVDRFHLTAGHLKTQFYLHCSMVENQTRVLGRLHELSNILRSSSSLIILVNKLRKVQDLLCQADIHSKLSQLLEDIDLKDIDFIKENLAYYCENSKKIRNLTQMMLIRSLRDRNTAKVIFALKVFYNFKYLSNCVNNLITRFVSEIEASLKDCFSNTHDSNLDRLDVTKLYNKSKCSCGPQKIPLLSANQNFGSEFWNVLNCIICDELFECCEQTMLLKYALEQVHNYGLIIPEQNLCKQFWAAVLNMFRKSFAECPTHVLHTLQDNLPKLLFSTRGLERRLNGLFVFDYDIFALLEKGYINRSAAKMKDCLSGADLPSNEIVDNFIRIASGEVSAALIDCRLLHEISSIFIACGNEICAKLEAQIQFGVDSMQVVDTPNYQQERNTTLANILFYYKNSVKCMLSDMKDQFVKISGTTYHDILNSLQKADFLISTVLQHITNSVISIIKIILLSIHREPGLDAEKICTSAPSKYMKELQEFIQRTWTNHFLPFHDKKIVASCGLALSKKCIELFIFNLSIVRPLSQTGRNRLKYDCLFMEQVLKPMCGNISDLGKWDRLLRAMSLLIVQKPNELVQQITGGDSLVPNYLVLFLLFGYAGDALQSPHIAANLSTEHLMEWLEEHTSEGDKLELISCALQRYRDTIQRKNIGRYDEVYCLLIKGLEEVMMYHDK